jgi:GNAT superfamily N-acetyltransferase
MSVRGTTTQRNDAAVFEIAEARAYADFFRYAPASWGFTVRPSPAATALIAPSVDVPLFNRALAVGLTAPCDVASVDALLTEYRHAAIRNFAIQLAPGARPPGIGESLRTRGLAVRDAWAKLRRGAAPAAAVTTDLVVERIGRASADQFAAVACAGFQMPERLAPWLAETVGQAGWHHYIAVDHGVPMACAAMYLSETIAWLGIEATVPSHRRRGAQSVLVARCIEDGRALGCEEFVAETGEDLPARPNSSFRNLIRAGFTVAYHRPNYMAI